MYKLDYSDCISPLPLTFRNIGSIRSPKLIDVFNITYFVYAQYIAHLRMTPEEYFESYYKDEKIDFETVIEMTKFDLVLNDDRIRKIITDALNFFFIEDFEFYPEYEAFISTKQNDSGTLEATGVIDKNNYADIIDIILQRVHITPDENDVDDISKIKNKRGLKIYMRMKQVKKEFKKHKPIDSKMTFPNIISSIAAKSNTIGWHNIFDITIFQLFDLCERLQILTQYDIASTQVAAWGDKEKKFEINAWMTNIYDKNENNTGSK